MDYRPGTQGFVEFVEQIRASGRAVIYENAVELDASLFGGQTSEVSEMDLLMATPLVSGVMSTRQLAAVEGLGLGPVVVRVNVPYTARATNLSKVGLGVVSSWGQACPWLHTAREVQAAALEVVDQVTPKVLATGGQAVWGLGRAKDYTLDEPVLCLRLAYSVAGRETVRYVDCPPDGVEFHLPPCDTVNVSAVCWGRGHHGQLAKEDNAEDQTPIPRGLSWVGTPLQLPLRAVCTVARVSDYRPSRVRCTAGVVLVDDAEDTPLGGWFGALVVPPPGARRMRVLATDTGHLRPGVYTVGLLSALMFGDGATPPARRLHIGAVGVVGPGAAPGVSVQVGEWRPVPAFVGGIPVRVRRSEGDESVGDWEEVLGDFDIPMGPGGSLALIEWEVEL